MREIMHPCDVYGRYVCCRLQCIAVRVCVYPRSRSYRSVFTSQALGASDNGCAQRRCSSRVAAHRLADRAGHGGLVRLLRKFSRLSSSRAFADDFDHFASLEVHGVRVRSACLDVTCDTSR